MNPELSAKFKRMRDENLDIDAPIPVCDDVKREFLKTLLDLSKLPACKLPAKSVYPHFEKILPERKVNEFLYTLACAGYLIATKERLKELEEDSSNPYFLQLRLTSRALLFLGKIMFGEPAPTPNPDNINDRLYHGYFFGLPKPVEPKPIKVKKPEAETQLPAKRGRRPRIETEVSPVPEEIPIQKLHQASEEKLQARLNSIRENTPQPELVSQLLNQGMPMVSGIYWAQNNRLESLIVYVYGTAPFLKLRAWDVYTNLLSEPEPQHLTWGPKINEH